MCIKMEESKINETSFLIRDNSRSVGCLSRQQDEIQKKRNSLILNRTYGHSIVGFKIMSYFEKINV